MPRLDDGFQTLITFSENPSIKLWEKTVQPPGFVGRGANNVSTMRNTRMVTKSPKKLLDVSDIKLTCAYDPAVYDQILAMAQVVQEITVEYPDGSTLTVWGWLDEFQPGDHQEGAQPEADVTIIVGNLDDSLAEVEPNYTAP